MMCPSLLFYSVTRWFILGSFYKNRNQHWKKYHDFLIFHNSIALIGLIFQSIGSWQFTRYSSSRSSTRETLCLPSIKNSPWWRWLWGNQCQGNSTEESRTLSWHTENDRGEWIWLFLWIIHCLWKNPTSFT